MIQCRGNVLWKQKYSIGELLRIIRKTNTPKNCKQVLADMYNNAWRKCILNAYNYDWKLESYFLVNPCLNDLNFMYVKPTFQIDSMLYALPYRVTWLMNWNRSLQQSKGSKRWVFKLPKCWLLQHTWINEINSVEKYLSVWVTISSMWQKFLNLNFEHVWLLKKISFNRL